MIYYGNVPGSFSPIYFLFVFFCLCLFWPCSLHTNKQAHTFKSETKRQRVTKKERKKQQHLLIIFNPMDSSRTPCQHNEMISSTTINRNSQKRFYDVTCTISSSNTKIQTLIETLEQKNKDTLPFTLSEPSDHVLVTTDWLKRIKITFRNPYKEQLTIDKRIYSLVPST